MDNALRSRYKITNAGAFCLLFILTLILYLPAVKAGWVIDAVGWIYDMKHHGFLDFINRKESQSQSFYQLFAIHYFICYKLWGMNTWAWGLLYIVSQSVNACLLFVFCDNILSDSGVRNNAVIALTGAILFTVCPHISEAVIWKACYHYLLGFLFILLVTRMAQKYQHAQRSEYAWGAAIIFVLSAFGLEVFYLIPFFVLSVALYYRFALDYDRAIFRKTLSRFFIPQIIILCVYFIALVMAYKFFKPHKTDFSQSATDYLSKPVKYFFHILFLARYFPIDLKNKLYAICESLKTLALFYGVAVSVFLYAAVRLKKMDGSGKAMFFFYVLIVLTIGFLMSVAFPDAGLLVFYDRYTYFADGFIYTLLASLVIKFFNKYVALSLLLAYAVVNIYFTVEVNTYWKRSAYVNDRLLHGLPDIGDKTIVLLNVPENMNGVPMIGSQPSSKFRDTYEVFFDSVFKNNIYDAASYNMVTMNDGAHVMVINDSVIHVTLNQWGTWWWYEGHGGKSYENDYYKLNLVDGGHWYELTLKHPAGEYVLLYENGPNWRTVDMNKKNTDQY